MSSAILDVAIAIPDAEIDALTAEVELALGSRCLFFSERAPTT